MSIVGEQLQGQHQVAKSNTHPTEWQLWSAKLVTYLGLLCAAASVLSAPQKLNEWPRVSGISLCDLCVL